MTKELEALNNLWNQSEEVDYQIIEDYELIKSALERKEKLEKVWKIVKNINADHLRLIKESISFLDYMEWYGIACEKDECNLNETEFNLLKEMLI